MALMAPRLGQQRIRVQWLRGECLPGPFGLVEKRIIDRIVKLGPIRLDSGHLTRKTGRVNEITLEAEVNRPHQDLTALEAARLLGVSKLHVIDLLEAGEIDYHMVGADVMFNAAEIASYKSDREHRDAEALVSA